MLPWCRCIASILLLNTSFVVCGSFKSCSSNATIEEAVCLWRTREAPASPIVLRAARVSPLPVLVLNNNLNSQQSSQAPNAGNREQAGSQQGGQGAG